MDLFLEFIKSDIGVAISWLCAVISVLFGFIKGRENKNLKTKIVYIENQVNQHGGKSVNTKNNSGGMNINM